MDSALHVNTVPDSLGLDTILVGPVGDALLPTRPPVFPNEVLEGVPCHDLPIIMVALGVLPSLAVFALLPHCPYNCLALECYIGLCPHECFQ